MARTSQRALVEYRPVFEHRAALARRFGLPEVFGTLGDFVARGSALVGSPQQIVDKVLRFSLSTLSVTEHPSTSPRAAHSNCGECRNTGLINTRARWMRSSGNSALKWPGSGKQRATNVTRSPYSARSCSIAG